MRFLRQGWRPSCRWKLCTPTRQWCFGAVFFDGGGGRPSVVPFLDLKRSIPDIIAEIETERGLECVRIDPETHRRLRDGIHEL